MDTANRSPRYMPIWWASRVTPQLCDGRCIVVELGGAVLIPGAISWDDVTAIPEHQDMMRLFAFFIEVCVRLCIGFSIEIVVDDTFASVHKNTVTEELRPAGYRLWIPLDAVTFDHFVDTAYAVLTPEACKDMNAYNSLYYAKKMRSATDTKAHHKEVTSMPEFKRIVRLYRAGKSVPLDTEFRQYIELFCVKSYFQRYTTDAYHPRQRISAIQKNPCNYIRPSMDSGKDRLDPDSTLISTGLFRSFETGPDGFIKARARELFDYTLPTREPTHAELVSKMSRVLSATGQTVRGVAQLSKTELLGHSQTANVDVYADPHEYSPITLSDPHAEITATTFEKIIRKTYRITTAFCNSVSKMREHYTSIALRALAKKQSHPLTGSSKEAGSAPEASSTESTGDAPEPPAAESADTTPALAPEASSAESTGDAPEPPAAESADAAPAFPTPETPKNTDPIETATKQLYELYVNMADDVGVLTSTDTTPGVPVIYNKLTTECGLLLQIMIDGPAERLVPEQKLARSMWAFRSDDTGDQMKTPASRSMEIIASCSQSCLWLLPPQQIAFLPIWLRTFAATRIDTEGCPNYIMIGKPDVGKTKTWQEVVNCLPTCMVVTSDSGSRLKHTGIKASRDLHIQVVDEYKHIALRGEDRNSSTETKNEQTRISTGVLTHDRLEQNPETGEYETVYYTSICRWFTVSSTNNPAEIVDAIASRTCFMPLMAMSEEAKEMYVTPSAAISAVDESTLVCRKKAWHLVMKTLAATQCRYTIAEACGAFPPIDMRCYTMFWKILEAVLGIDRMSPRRTKDIKTLSVSIMMWNCIRTWYMDGLGAEFRFDQSVEMLFYARYRYLRMEDVVLAYTLLEQSRSHTVQTQAIMQTLKSDILVHDGQLVEDNTGDYWVLRFRKWRNLEHSVTIANPNIGAGVCEQMLKLIQRTTTCGMPNLRMDHVAHLDEDRFVVNKAWISEVCTPTEAAILRELHSHITRNSKHVNRDYDTERMWVFSSKIRAALTGAGQHHETIRLKELANIAPATIRHAMCTLEQRCIPDTQIPLIQRPCTEVAIALVQPKPGPGAVPCKHDPTKFKKKTNAMNAIVVHPDTFDIFQATTVESAEEKFLKTTLAVAGTYEGRKIFAGVPTDPTGDIQDSFYTVVPDKIESITVSNRLHFKPPGAIHDMIAKNEQEFVCPFDRDDPLFPSDQREFTVGAHTMFEVRLAERARARIPVDPVTQARFDHYMN